VRARAAWVVLAGWLSAGCGAPAQPGSARSADDQPLRVVRGALEDRFLLTGELEAVQNDNLVVPRTPVWMLSIRWLAPDGAQVKKGDRVVEFDASSFATALDDKRLAVVRAGGELASEASRIAVAVADKEMELSRKQAELQRAQVEVNVPADLYPRRVFQEKQLALERQRDALAKAEEDLSSQRRGGALEQKVKALALARARRELEELRERLSDLVLKAPRDGLVQIAVNRREGRRFLVGDQAYPGWPVAAMPQLSAMQVRARLHDVDDGAVREGMPADCVLDAYPDRVWKGTVRSVSPIARGEGRDARRRFFDVVISLEQTAPDRMRPGMSVRVEVVRRRARDVLLVPRLALRSSGNRFLVRLQSGREETSQPVQIDWCTEVACVLRSGLVEGTALRPEPPVQGGSAS
jgi:HlyD family secretion protein